VREQDSNPPKADFDCRLNLLLGSHPARSTKKQVMVVLKPLGFEEQESLDSKIQ
jgi:hypothetical protein